jgi:hypothetical protein
VDVFFVISGFLITSIIYREMENNTFSLTNFYERRIRRIFPALFFTLFSTLAVSYWLLDPGTFKNLGSAIFSTTFFTSNFLLMNQAGYFDKAAELKPLALLGEVSEEQQPALVLHLKQGCRSFDSSYAVFDLFSAIQTGQFEQLNINQLQQGVISIQANGEALCHALDADVFQLLQCLEQKQSLSEIPEVLLAHLNSIMALDLVDGFTLKSI